MRARRRVEAGRSLEENLIREVWEETGLAIVCGRSSAVSEFPDPASGHHQGDLIHRAEAARGATPVLADPDGVVNRSCRTGEAETAELPRKPDRLARIDSGPEGLVVCVPQETLVR